MKNDFGIAVTDAITVEVTFNYQTTSREYIEFCATRSMPVVS
jgi:hypothetical protein